MSPNLSQHITSLLSYQRLIIGYSGGLDSTVLLHLIASNPSLKAKTTAIHINHGLSDNADHWQAHCQDICDQLSIPFQAYVTNIHKQAGESLEEKAREMRYQLFESALHKKDCLVLGHHLADQAETVLLQLFRGAGVQGLSGMAVLSQKNQYTLARPLLPVKKIDIERYANTHQLSWIEDESNQDTRFSRNYLRQTIMPKLNTQFKGVNKSIYRSAQHCANLYKAMDELLTPHYANCVDGNHLLLIENLKRLSENIQALIVRKWLTYNGLKTPNSKRLVSIFHSVINAKSDKTPSICWPGGCVKRYKGKLYGFKQNIMPVRLKKEIVWDNLIESLRLPDNLGALTSDIQSGTSGLSIPKNSTISVRFRQGGETIFLNNCHQKLKKLFQAWDVPPWERERIPLLYINGELACIVGHAISQSFSLSGTDCYHIAHISC